jgi:hypothetical protein
MYLITFNCSKILCVYIVLYGNWKESAFWYVADSSVTCHLLLLTVGSWSSVMVIRFVL